MEVITSILFKSDFIRIICESGLALDLPMRIEYSGRFSKGDTIDDELIEELKVLSEENRCRNRALLYCTRGPKTEKQLSDYLAGKDFSKSAVGKTVEWLREHSYLDDYRYAVDYLLSLSARKVVGRKYAENKLLQKGIDRNLIKRALDEKGTLFFADERMYELALNKYSKVKDKTNSYEKVARFLASRGFESGDIIKLLSRMREEGITFK